MRRTGSSPVRRASWRRRHGGRRAPGRWWRRVVRLGNAIDVDATDEKPLDSLQRSFRGDIGLYCRARVRTRRHIFFRSGTIVLSPGRSTTAFIDAWCEAAGCSGYGTVDQDSLLHAVESATGATLQVLPIAYCATKHDIDNGLVAIEDVALLHEQASFSSMQKESWLSKRSRRIMSALKYGT